MHFGQHPRNFNFDRRGRMVPNIGDAKHYTTTTESRPNARRGILERVLCNGAAWETPTTELIAKVTKRKFTKARMGSKAAKHAERMELCADELDGESATMYRARACSI